MDRKRSKGNNKRKGRIDFKVSNENTRKIERKKESERTRIKKIKKKRKNGNLRRKGNKIQCKWRKKNKEKRDRCAERGRQEEIKYG